MFFRRETPHTPSFDERIQNLKKFQFSSSTDPGGGVRVTRNGFAAVVKDLGEGKVGVSKAGVLVDNEIAEVVHGGYQMFLKTPSGKTFPALAEQLRALHSFDEDLREGLGLISLYNLSLGTTADAHMYDRVVDRDRPHGPRPWERKAQAHS
jgi:hypothetical protein